MAFKAFKIWVDTLEERDAVLQRLEDEGYKWNGTHKKPTDKGIIATVRGVGIFAYKHGVITWGQTRPWFNEHDHNEITCEEYVTPTINIPDFEAKFEEMLTARP